VQEILDGVAAGLTNAQIGRQMFLSAKTVANNVSNILAKLQLAERGQAIVAARDAGLGRRPDGAPEDRDAPSGARGYSPRASPSARALSRL